jgi:hypothetical protein
MTSSIDYFKIYTHAPEAHPNIIRGSLQLLFWFVFRPKALLNHLTTIDVGLHPSSSQKLCYYNRALWKLMIQVYIILPVLTNIISCFILSVLAINFSKNTIIISALHAITTPTSIVVIFLLSITWFIVIGLILKMGGEPIFSMTLTMIFGLPFGVVSSVIFGIAFGIACDISWELYWGTAWGIAIFLLGILMKISSKNSPDVVVIIAWSIGATINLWRPIMLYPLLLFWNTLLYQIEKNINFKYDEKSKSSLILNCAFWDEFQYIPIIGLNKHLFVISERNPNEAKAAIKYLSGTFQDWAVRETEKSIQIELDARSLDNCKDVRIIAKAHIHLHNGELQNPISEILNIFIRISEDVETALNQKSTYNKRLILKSIIDRLDLHLQELIRSNNKYARRFYPIVQSWREIISKYIEELVQQTELRQEIDSPYTLAIPLTQEQEIFAGRNDMGTRIEQLILDRRHPPLLLYGQRRMGKTSLLNNLGKLLPNTIIPLFVDLQGAPSSAINYAGFLYNLARGMINSAKKQAVTLPVLTREKLANDPFTYFNEWLNEVEQVLEQNIGLLMLDEFEVLDSAVNKGRFDEQDVFGMLRHLIQHRPRFKVLLAGSHTIEEYQRWASYLINVQVVHISYLKENEARQLIEHPVKDFTLRYEPEAVERVLQLTRCHPFLVQLLCSEIVALKNEQDPSIRRLARLEDVEAAVPQALSSGQFFFADIQNNQVDAAGRDILRFIAAQGEGAVVSHKTIFQHFPNVADSTIKLLLQRELIEKQVINNGYCYQIELIRQWFNQIL